MASDTAPVSANDALTKEQYARWYDERGFPELRQVLFWRWDPVGAVDEFPSTADEYDSYARVLLSRLRGGATAEDVAAYLLSVERDVMGIGSHDEAKLRTLGETVLYWYEVSILEWTDRSR